MTADLDGLTPIRVDLPSADVLVDPIESHDCPKESSPDPDCFDGGDVEEVTIIFSTKSTAASSSVINQQRCRKQPLAVAHQIQYGLLPSQSPPLKKVATFALLGHESTLVDIVVQGDVPFQGSSLIDAIDLAP